MLYNYSAAISFFTQCLRCTTHPMCLEGRSPSWLSLSGNPLLEVLYNHVHTAGTSVRYVHVALFLSCIIIHCQSALNKLVSRPNSLFFYRHICSRKCTWTCKKVFEASIAIRFLFRSLLYWPSTTCMSICSVTVVSRSWNANLVLDGHYCVDFPNGSTAQLELHDSDSLRTLHSNKTTLT